jgi:multiple sugar transport system permease protein
VPYAILVLPLFAVMLHVPLVGGNDIFGQGGIGLYNSMVGLLVPSIFDAISIFLLVQFFRSIPMELSDAARIDGASEWRILWSVILPLSFPGLATVAVLQFAQLWNSYLWPLVMSSSDDLYTVTVGLSQLKSVAGSVGGSAPTSNALAPEVLAGSILAVIPVFVVFVVGQRYLRRGIALSGMK